MRVWKIMILISYFAGLPYCQHFTWYKNDAKMGKAVFLSYGTGKKPAQSWNDALNQCRFDKDDPGYLARLDEKRTRQAVIDYVKKEIEKTGTSLGKSKD